MTSPPPAPPSPPERARVEALFHTLDRAYYAERCDSYEAARSALLDAFEALARRAEEAERALEREQRAHDAYERDLRSLTDAALAHESAASSALETMRARADGLEALLRRFAPDAASLVADVRAALASPSGTPADEERSLADDAPGPSFKVSVAKCAELRAAGKCAGASCPECPAAAAPDATPEDAP